MPRGQLDFYVAMKIAKAYLDADDLDGAEKFVTEAVIVDESNDPQTVVAFTFRDIANIYRDQRDLVNAKKYIDKAMEVGGDLYYSGYSIQVSQRSIYGELTKELDQFAQAAANYQGHMGRELLQNLIQGLVKAGHFDEAKQITKYFDSEADVNSSMTRIAAAQAAAGDIEAAQQLVNHDITNALSRSLARLAMAKALWHNGQRDSAADIALGEYRTLQAEEWGAANDQRYQDLLSLFGSMQRSEEVSVMLDKATTPWREAFGLTNAIKGFAESHKAVSP